MRLTYITLFGILGVLSRYYLGMEVNRLLPSSFPLGTFFINILGAFVIGIVYVAGVEGAALSEDLRIGVMVGYLGGFTTFSSYCLEVIQLLEEAEYGYAFLYTGLSTFLGFGASFLGMLITRTLFTNGSTY